MILNHLNNFPLSVGIVFDIALGSGKGGLSGQHADIVQGSTGKADIFCGGSDECSATAMRGTALKANVFV